MRRPSGHYGATDSTYSTMPHHHQQQQQQQIKSEHQNHQNQNQNQWRWEQRDTPKLPTNSMSPNIGQGSDASRSYYQSQRADPRLAPENQGGKDPRAHSREENMEIGYEDNARQQTLEGLEQKFLDDIMKLTKEQNDAEDTENSRHRERINAINAQYQEQLVALRARHASRRDEVLRRESHARKQQYDQAALDNYPHSSMSASNARGYMAMNSPAGERQAAYNADNYDSYRERARLAGSERDHGYEPRAQYPGGRMYDAGSRYY